MKQNCPTHFRHMVFAIVAILGLTHSLAALAQTGDAAGANKSSMAVTLPATPAGRQLEAWLVAINTGDRATIRQFVAANYASPPDGALQVDRITARQMGFYKNSGGFELRQIIGSAPDKIGVLVQARRTSFWTHIRLSVSTTEPNKILGLGFAGVEAPEAFLSHEKLTDSELRERIDDLITKLDAVGEFSGVIVVARGGKPIYQRATGLASRAWNAPNRIDTKFNIASIGKMFTAVAVAQLVEAGKLTFDETLDKALPDYPSKEIAGKVTVGQLLSHMSGLTPDPAAPSADLAFARRLRTLSAYLSGDSRDTLAFEPGAKLAYSNYGYLVLGAVIEKASGQNYYDYIREHIYKPAHMTGSDSFDLETEPQNLATGYADGPGGERRSNIFQLPPRGLPYGLGYATAEDLVRFGQALQDRILLNSASLDAAWTGRADYPEADSQYGYGFIIRKYNGARIVGHGGGWPGATDKVDYYLGLGYTVVILTNIDSAPNPIAFRLREWITQGRS